MALNLFPAFNCVCGCYGGIFLHSPNHCSNQPWRLNGRGGSLLSASTTEDFNQASFSVRGLAGDTGFLFVHYVCDLDAAGWTSAFYFARVSNRREKNGHF